MIWWPRAELNHRHKDFQSSALPTELLGHLKLQRPKLHSRKLRPGGELYQPRPAPMDDRHSLAPAYRAMLSGSNARRGTTRCGNTHRHRLGAIETVGHRHIMSPAARAGEGDQHGDVYCSIELHGPGYPYRQGHDQARRRRQGDRAENGDRDQVALLDGREVRRRRDVRAHRTTPR